MMTYEQLNDSIMHTANTLHELDKKEGVVKSRDEYLNRAVAKIFIKFAEHMENWKSKKKGVE